MTEKTIPFWEELGLPAPGTKMTPEEYRALPEVNIHMEHMNGVVVYPDWNEETMSPSPNADHTDIVMNLISLLLARIPNGRLRTAPADVRLGGRTVQPDVFWVAEGGACIKRDGVFQGPPDLVVEILSPSNSRYDRGEKYELYEANGVHEYWMVDPGERFMEVYALEDGAFQRVGVFAPEASFTSSVLGASVDVSAAFA